RLRCRRRRGVGTIVTADTLWASVRPGTCPCPAPENRIFDRLHLLRFGGRSMNHRWAPALVGSLRGYTWRTFFADLTAGVTVGLVALPLAMAFAISSGVPPQAGLYCAVVAGFLISALGGSR